MASSLSGSILFEVTLDSSGNISNVAASTESRVGDYHQIAGNVRINNGTNTQITSTNANAVRMAVAVYDDSNYTGTPTYLYPLKTDSTGNTLTLDDNDKVQMNNTYNYAVFNQTIGAESSGDIQFTTGENTIGFTKFTSVTSAVTSSNSINPPKFPLGFSTSNTIQNWRAKYIKVWFTNSHGSVGCELGLANSDLASRFISDPLVYSGGSLGINIEATQQNFVS